MEAAFYVGICTNTYQGGEKYQQAFYVFEELAAPAASSPQSLISQAVAEIHLGRLEEAEVALQQALAKEPGNSTAMANNIVLNALAGKDITTLKRYFISSCLP